MRSRYSDEVTYGDQLPDEPIDLLWTNRDIVSRRKIGSMVYFASVAHRLYVHQKVREFKNISVEAIPEGMMIISDRIKYLRTLYNSDLILVIGNQTIKETFHRYSPSLSKQIFLSDCGIDVKHYKFLNQKPREDIFVFSATRFSIRKGSHFLQEVWPIIVNKYPNCRLLLLGKIGDYDLQKKLKDYKGVDFYGEFQSGSEEYLRLLNNSKWIVFPSLAEGQAGTVLEAMCCGCIPIVSRESGIDGDRYGGFVVEPNNPSKLVEQMFRAIEEWSEEKHFTVRSQTEKFHQWKDFEENVLCLSQNLLEKSNYKQSVVWKTYPELLLSRWR